MLKHGHLSGENIQGLEEIKQQLQSLRRENHFLKVGLVFCLVLSAMPYITGFQPETITAKTVVTEKIEFVRDGKTVMSIVAHPKADGLVIQDKNNLPAVWVYRSQDGGVMGVCDGSGRLVASIYAKPEGGAVGVYNKDGKPVAIMIAKPEGGAVGAYNKDGKHAAAMGAWSEGGILVAHNKDGKLVAVMAAKPEGGALGVCNNAGKLVAQMYAQSEGGAVTTHNKNGETVALMTALPYGGSIALYDNKGHELVAVDVTPLCGRIEIKGFLGQTIWSAP
jgi:hypothetical protein